jgi:hypothetical protein
LGSPRDRLFHVQRTQTTHTSIAIVYLISKWDTAQKTILDFLKDKTLYGFWKKFIHYLQNTPKFEVRQNVGEV